MTSSGHSNPSLKRRLLWVLISALTGVAIALGAGGTLLVLRVADRSFDRLLGASVGEIAETLAPERGAITLDIPPSALSMLEDAERDNVYYSVRHDNRLLTGYPDLPTIRIHGLGSSETAFDFSHIRGQEVRVGAEALHLPGIVGQVVVEVAHTTDARQRLILFMLSSLYLLELILVSFAGALIWPALKWGLRPVDQLREELEVKPVAYGNFAPLNLRYAPCELLGLVEGFNHLLKRLEDSTAGMRQFTADASHQMRTPLAILKTHVAVLRRNVMPTRAGASSLADIESAVSRLEALLTDLIDLARADTVLRGGIARTRVDLRTLIAQVIGELVQLAAQRDITLAVNAAERPVWVYAERVIAAEILENVLDNAIRYSEPGGSVFILLAQTAQSATVSVEDDGPGIPVSEREHVFERFYRLQRDQATPGSGLGLSIVRTLSQAIHAEVAIDTASSGRGLKVAVQFQLAPAQLSAASATSQGHRVSTVRQAASN